MMLQNCSHNLIPSLRALKARGNLILMLGSPWFRLAIDINKSEKLFLIGIISSLLTLVTGCSNLSDDNGLFRDRATNYQQAHLETPLAVPDDINTTMNGTVIVLVANDTTALPTTFEPPRSGLLKEHTNQKSVQINKLGSQQWLLVDEAPGQVWPRLRGFLNENQLTLNRADAVMGVLETVELQPVGEPSLRERYRLRIEQGVQRGTSEVYVTQVTVNDEFIGWPEQSSNNEREAIMLEALADYLRGNATTAGTPVSMLAQQAISSPGKADIEQPKHGKPYITLQLPFDRAWLSLKGALEKAGFDIEDMNRNERLYYVLFVEENNDINNKQGGGLARWLQHSKKTDQEASSIDYIVTIDEASPQMMMITISRQDDEPLLEEEELKQLNVIKQYLE